MIWAAVFTLCLATPPDALWCFYSARYDSYYPDMIWKSEEACRAEAPRRVEDWIEKTIYYPALKERMIYFVKCDADGSLISYP